MFHYTDKSGWNAIRSQVDWKFKVSQPQDPDRPEGAYFTTLAPTRSMVRLLHQKIRVPVEKREYVFEFTGNEGLIQLNNGRGRDRYIYFSPVDYVVGAQRQQYTGETSSLTESLP